MHPNGTPRVHTKMCWGLGTGWQCCLVKFRIISKQTNQRQTRKGHSFVIIDKKDCNAWNSPLSISTIPIQNINRSYKSNQAVFSIIRNISITVFCFCSVVKKCVLLWLFVVHLSFCMCFVTVSNLKAREAQNMSHINIIYCMCLNWFIKQLSWQFIEKLLYVMI